MEVTADDLAPDDAPAWPRCRWILGTSRGEITTGARAPSMHATVLIDGRPFVYGWHYWRPAAVEGLEHGGSWKVLWDSRGPSGRM